MDGNEVIANLRRNGELVEQFLREELTAIDLSPPRLREAIEYSLFAGGKRLRPALVMEAWRACDGPEESRQAALAAASAIELVHTFSLVHDDLPAMDDDDLRRGRPTNHKVFGEAMAILAGDAMLAMSFEVIIRHAPPPTSAAMVRELASAAGPAGMIGGQVMDMEAQGQSLTLEQLQQIHQRKTGALLTAAGRLGALAAAADENRLEAMTEFGRHLGLAFQIVDDLLDVTATPQQLGKATAKDTSRGKVTYPALLGMDASRAEAERQLSAALKALAPFEAKGTVLAELAAFVVHRQN